MNVEYAVALDRNGDGFICMDAAPGDALNLMPNPVSYQGLPIDGDGIQAFLTWRLTAYGTRALDTTFVGGGSPAAVHIGKSGSSVSTIAVSEGQTYSAGIWAQGRLNAGAQPLALKIYNQNMTERASQSFAIDEGWTRLAVTFTAGSGDTHIVLAVEKPAGGITMTADLAGPMLVTGATLPAGFNSGDPRDLNDYITPDVLALRWRLGLETPGDSMAAPTSGEITVRNEDGRYSPELSDDALAPGTPVRIRAHHDGITYDLLRAVIDHVQPQAGDLAGRTAVIHLHGPERTLSETRTLIPLLTEARSDTVIAAVLNRAPLHRLGRSLQTGESVFAYVGDTWGDGIPARTAIRQVVEAERGRFFSDRLGQLQFYNRRALRDGWPPLAALQDDFEALDYRYGAALANHIRVSIRPRAIGAAGSTIWELANPQRVAAGDCRRVLALLRDTNDNPMGAIDVIAPAAGTDYSANTSADGTGANVTGQVSVTLPAGEVHGSAITLEVCNHSDQTVYLMPGSRLRGTPLTQADPMRIEERDDDSIDRHGPRVQDFNLPHLVTIDEARELARIQLYQRRHPFGLVERLSLRVPAHIPAALGLTLFDLIAIHEGRTGHGGEYFIVAEEHHIDAGGARHQVSWLLEAANAPGYWRMGITPLGQTKLAFTLG
jgi:hypothetical protein